ncbi:MAG: taurine catabolism dioxygenase TauD [Burkholderiales bacterium]|nr:MAG: taurine catabolism dioxygenase TauD [Burkholderiales bacterium]
MGAFTARAVAGNPFSLEDDAAYRRWRDWKLASAPARADALIVEVGDPCRLNAAEHEAIVARCRTSNMAVYASRHRGEGKDVARLLGEQLGLRRLDANWLADEDGISTLSVGEPGTRGEFIPYTDRPIRWHTDGYYNPPGRTIAAMLLHCVERAAEGGGNRLLDHEIAYILLRDADPEHVRALSAPDAMSIPQRDGEMDADGSASVARQTQAGPVFSLLAPGGDLHMRYTARTRSIAWRDDPATRAAVAALRAALDADGPWVYSLRLESGMGIVCNNVLHERDGFVDSDEHRRTVLRARYHDRIAGTHGSFADALAH